MDINKFVKRDEINFIVAILLLFLVVIMMFLSNSLATKNTYLKDVTSPAKSAYVKSEYEPFIVAEDENKENCFAIIHDDNNNLFLIKGNKNKIKSLYKNDNNHEELLTGTAFKTEENIINFAIEGYNVYADETILNTDNYSSFFGDYYLDISCPALSTIFIQTSCIIFSILSIVFFTLSILGKINTTTILNSSDYKTIEKELKDVEQLNSNIILTKSYLLIYNYGLTCYKYKDINNIELVKNKNNYKIVFTTKQDSKAKKILLREEEIANKIVNTIKSNKKSK